MNIHKKIQIFLWEQKANLAAAICGLLCSIALSGHADVGAYLQLRYLRWRLDTLHTSVALPTNILERVSAEKNTTARAVSLSQPLSFLVDPSLHQAAPVLVHVSATSSTSSISAPAHHATLLAMQDEKPSSPLAPAQSSSTAVSPSVDSFPPMVRTTFPVSQAINWGAMDRPQAWNRTYAEMMPGDFVPVPAYDMQKLTVPMQSLLQPRNIPEITRKLFYSTRFFGAYDLDSGEWTAVHPAIDIKMPIGTPVLAAAGGRVYSVTQSQTLGLHVLIEHRHPTDGTFYSIYGHLGSVAVQAGDDVLPGQTIGFVGMTGNTSGPHVHFQVDRKTSIEPHIVYFPDSVPSHAEAAKWVMHPITFLQNYAAGVQ